MSDVETNDKPEGEAIVRPKPDRKPKQPPPGVKLYRIEQAAWLLQMSITSVRRLVASGKLPYRRTIAGLRFIDADLDDYINHTAERRGEADSPERRAAKKVRARSMTVDSRVIEADNKQANRKG